MTIQSPSIELCSIRTQQAYAEFGGGNPVYWLGGMIAFDVPQNSQGLAIRSTGARKGFLGQTQGDHHEFRPK